jgi:hypothetical protein
MLLLKVVITIVIVTALSIIAERVSPRAAGILSGYPLGSAISLFFIGLEQGPVFAGASALYNVAGLAALLSFFFVYYQVSRRLDRFSIPAASLAALTCFFAVDGLLQLLHFTPLSSVLTAGAAILGFSAIFRSIPDVKIRQKVRLGPGVLAFRAGLSALIILGITGAAGLVPSSWAGLFSAFPATVFPLVLIMHSTYGSEQAHTVIKNVPTGLWALMLYSLTLSYVYPRYGIYLGTLIGFGVATLYLIGLGVWISRKGFSGKQGALQGSK